MNIEVQVIPVVQIRPRYLLIYDRLEGLPPRTDEAKKISLEALHARSTYDGLLNFNSIKRMKRAIELLVAISKPKEAVSHKTGKTFTFKVNFVTLTLPAPQETVTDKQLKKECLDVWIKAARREFKLKSYVWRAERQKNGNLHFHFCTDVYIPFDRLRDSWNQRLQRFHFINDYHAKHNKWHPNSTDVHSVQNIRDLAAYMVKYMTKLKKNEQKIDGAVWDCSKNLKRKGNCEFIIDSATSEMINNAITVHLAPGKVTEHCTLIFLDEKQFDSAITGIYRQRYEEWLESIRNP